MTTMITSYSQYGEDVEILQQFDKPGRFLDIGAWDPKALSNTRALYEAGWSGVIIEPSPTPFLSQLREYGNDPRIVLIHAALGFERHCAEFWVTDDAVSTTEKEQYDKWKDHAKFIGKFWTPMITLADLFNQFGVPGFDFVNIDVEGKSVDVLAALMATQAMPKCICVEHDERIVEANSLVARHGYKQILLNGTNVVFAR
jgi:FkbM family methyltransferase